MNGSHLDQAKDAADDLVRFLDGYDANDDDRMAAEERVEELAGQVVAEVKHHNDAVAEKEMGRA